MKRVELFRQRKVGFNVRIAVTLRWEKAKANSISAIKKIQFLKLKSK